MLEPSTVKWGWLVLHPWDEESLCLRGPDWQGFVFYLHFFPCEACGILVPQGLKSSCIGRVSLNHGTARDVPRICILERRFKMDSGMSWEHQRLWPWVSKTESCLLGPGHSQDGWVPGTQDEAVRGRGPLTALKVLEGPSNRRKWSPGEGALSREGQQLTFHTFGLTAAVPNDTNYSK